MRSLIAACWLLCLLPCAAQAEDATTRGAYLARVGDCTSCHTAQGGKPYAGGLNLQTPLGSIYSTNITPDPDTGIGQYSEADFSRALRDGVAKDGHHLYPGMPYIFFAQISPEDMHDLYLYFMHDVTPVRAVPPPTQLPFPYNQRWGMAIWNLLFAPNKQFAADPSHDGAWNRGAYLVNGLGHCGACHTERNLIYAPRGYDSASPYFLHGDTLEGWFAPSLRGEQSEGLGRFSENDIAQFLLTGHAHGAMAFGTMEQAVENSTSYFTPRDASAVAHYLKSIPASDDETAYTPDAIQKLLSTPPTAAAELPGSGLYASACAGCHGANGEGRAPRIPALAGNPVVLSANTDSVIHIVLAGGAAPRVGADSHPAHMPNFSRFTDAEIAELVSYLRSQWGNHAPPATPREVRQMRDQVNRENNSASARAK